MLESIEALCAKTHNYHETDRVIGDFAIENGYISLPFLVDGQFFRIVGSKFNDGVYIYTEDELKQAQLTDEEFHGAVWPMNMPKAFIELSKEIEEYNNSEAAKPSPYLSESISGHYSYTRASASENNWEKVFASKLNRWRKAANIWL